MSYYGMPGWSHTGSPGSPYGWFSYNRPGDFSRPHGYNTGGHSVPVPSAAPPAGVFDSGGFDPGTFAASPKPTVDVTSTPRPEKIWTDRQINQQRNLAHNQSIQQSDIDWLAKQNQRPGMSLGASDVAVAAPQAASHEAAAARTWREIPMQMRMENSEQQRRAQHAQGMEAVNLFDIMRQMENARRQAEYEEFSSIFSPIMAYMFA